MKILSIVFVFFIWTLNVTPIQAQKIAEVDQNSNEVILTRSTDEYASIAQSYLEDGQVTDTRIIHNPEMSEFYLVGSVVNDSEGVRNIGVKLAVDGDDILYDNGLKFIVKCIGDPCNNCDMKFEGFGVKCDCIEDDCSMCRCNQVVETEVGAGFFLKGK